MSSNEKMQNWVKGVMWGSRDPILESWDPANISGTVEARNFKFGMETEGAEF